MEEEKRLCYVAMTRAKTELVMTWRKEVGVFTPNGIKYVTKDRSRFLDVLVSKKKASKRSPEVGRKTKQSSTTNIYNIHSVSFTLYNLVSYSHGVER